MGQLKGLLHSHNCAELRSADIGKEVTLCGWINKKRDLGALNFVDLRDKYGVTQLGFENFKGDINILKSCSLESVVKATGIVCERPASALNKKMRTGEVEIQVTSIELLSKANEVPFLPHGLNEANEDLRLKYRYLDLRSTHLQNMIQIRSEVAKHARMALYSEGFVEVETPILYKSTPEGARDYIVPSRVHPGKVYALPQSPQTLKQLLMIGNTDKYFQICKCFRDEDLRSDRQPEFTQIDIEVSFSTQEYMKNLATKLMRGIYELDDNYEFPIMSYADAMDTYGSDKPDIRFGLKHLTVTDLFKESSFATFKDIANNNGLVKAIFVPEVMGTFSRKTIDGLTTVVKPYGGKGVAWFKVAADDAFSGGISKFIDDSIYSSLVKQDENKGTGTWFFFADTNHDVAHACGDAVRKHFGKSLELIKEGEKKFLWVNDFPLLEYKEEEGRFFAKHHPFTMPKQELMEDFFSGDTEKLKNLTAEAYDLVCNGYELGGGSLRIYDSIVQKQMFQVLGMSEEEAQYQFGFFMEALSYGTPPHAGMAFGLDRVIMIKTGTDSIRDVIAFPKTNAATDLMASSPSAPAKAQTDELHFGFLDKKS
jgi:aspartyl-tRNA synthetase